MRGRESVVQDVWCTGVVHNRAYIKYIMRQDCVVKEETIGKVYYKIQSERWCCTKAYIKYIMLQDCDVWGDERVLYKTCGVQELYIMEPT